MKKIFKQILCGYTRIVEYSCEEKNIITYIIFQNILENIYDLDEDEHL